MDPSMNNLLKWSLENSTPTTAVTSTSDPSDPSTTSPAPHPSRPLDAAALAALFGGPSDADLMRSSMAAINSPDIPLDEKLVAFDNLEQLIESIDNANNLAPIGLWSPLIVLLSDFEPELRRMAAWCVGTAVQNNPQAQERALVGGALPTLVRLAVGDESEGVRRKACYALSSAMRNFQAGVDEVVRCLPEGRRVDGRIDAGDMDAVDGIMERLKIR